MMKKLVLLCEKKKAEGDLISLYLKLSSNKKIKKYKRFAVRS
jgi:hypothetical protein